MATLQISTYKHSTVMLNVSSWHNRWLVSVPYEVTDGAALDLCRAVQLLEREIHQNHVVYDSVIVVDYDKRGSKDPHTSQTYIPTGAESVGFQDTPQRPANYPLGLFVRKYPSSGYLGRWLFFGCMDADKVSQVPKKPYALEGIEFFQGIIDGWIAQLQHDALATLLMEQGMNRYKIATGKPPIIKLQAMHPTALHAFVRKEIKAPAKGIPVQEQIVTTSNLLGLWLEQLNSWYAFNADFVPVDAKYNTITLLGDAKAVASQAASTAQNQQQGQEQAGQALEFRWPPDAEGISEISDALNGDFSKDTEQISQKDENPIVGGGVALSHSDLSDIIARFVKYVSWVGSLAQADWSNSHQAMGSQ